MFYIYEERMLYSKNKRYYRKRFMIGVKLIIIKIEIVINDWGMLKSFLKIRKNYFTLSLGTILNKRKKDPRYIYKMDMRKTKNSYH